VKREGSGESSPRAAAHADKAARAETNDAKVLVFQLVGLGIPAVPKCFRRRERIGKILDVRDGILNDERFDAVRMLLRQVETDWPTEILHVDPGQNRKKSASAPTSPADSSYPRRRPRRGAETRVTPSSGSSLREAKAVLDALR
jgi:hypothetical protein